MHTLRDPRLREVHWRDLVGLSPLERAWELTLSLPWLLGSLALYQAGWIVPGAVASFFFFLTGLRQSHNAQHRCLGVGRRGHDLMLFALSGLMLASMHAVQTTHMHHHRHCLSDDDAEAAHVKLPWWRVLLLGPFIPVRLHAAAWSIADAPQRRWIAFELVCIALVLGLVVVGVAPVAVRWHAGAMLAGECMTGFFAVWTVHRGCRSEGQIARTQRGWLKNFISYSMFYHLEHHLFPAVPTCKLPELARRLDDACPEYRRHQVI